MNVTRRFALLAFAATVVVLGSARSSQATTVLQYTTSNPALTPLVVTDNGTSTTFTNNNSTGTAIKVNITLLNNVQVTGYMNFTGFTSNSPAVSFGGADLQQFQGTISFTSNANGTGINYLTATFTQGLYTSVNGSNAATVQASSNLRTQVSFTSSYYIFPGQATATDAISLGITDINPSSSIHGTTIAGYVANSSGNFSTTPPILINTGTPEPSTILGAGVACVAALGYGFRRRKMQAAA